MRNTIIILAFVISILIFNVNKSIAQGSIAVQNSISKYEDSISKYYALVQDSTVAQDSISRYEYLISIYYTLIQDSLLIRDSALIRIFNTLISKVDTDFLVDTIRIKNNIDSVQIDSLNNLYLVKGIYIDTNNGYTKYGKFYVLKYNNHQFSIIDSTSRCMYGNNNLDFHIHKDTLFIEFEMRRTSNDFVYVFNKHLQIYQLGSFSSGYAYSFHVKDKNGEDGYSLTRVQYSNYDIKKQLLSWKITGDMRDEEDKNYRESGKKKIVLPKDFPIQLRQFKTPLEMDDYDLILNQGG